jgi:UDP-N-acetylglucosamine---dolichyl-phosphate N-acetylglucosaminyltransferase
MKEKVCVIIPVYNEEKIISETLLSIPKKVKNKTVDVVVVNDGSTDNTSEVVMLHKRVHLINHILNFGAGAATRTGLHYAKTKKYDYVVTMDADGQHHPKDVEKVLIAVMNKEADMVIGSRLIESKGMPWYRKLGNNGLSIITYMVFGVRVKDSQSGLKALNHKAIIKLDWHSNRFAFCSEMLWRAKREGLSIKEIPITAIYTEYSLAKGQSNWGALDILKQLIKRRFLGIING